MDLERCPEVSAEAYRILRLFGAKVDRKSQFVSASFFGLWRRQAFYRPGLGTTLALAPIKAMVLPPSAPGPGQASLPWPEGDAPEPLRRLLDEALSTADPRRRTRAVLVVQGGRLIVERYAAGIDAGTPLPGWSMAKSVLGALIGALIKEGRLAPDQRRLLPEWSRPGDPRAEISLEDLLRMRSGLRFNEDYGNPLSDVVRMLFVEPDAAAFAASKNLAAEPGSLWHYSSGTANILSLIARRTLGEEAYPGFPRRALFDPLGMESAVLEPDASGTFIGSSFLFATARDWARFGQLQLQDGVWRGRRILPEGWTRFCSTPTPQAPDARYGALWWLKLHPGLGGTGPSAEALPPDAMHALGHEGQCLTVIPSRGLVVVRLGLSISLDAWDHAGFLAELLRTLA